VKKIVVVEKGKTVERDLACCGKDLLQAPQRMISYSCSTTLLFKVFQVWFERFEQILIKHG
jgi:hypothetical protein